MFQWLEKRIDPFAPFDEEETPPSGVGGVRVVLSAAGAALARGAVRRLPGRSGCSRPRST